MKRLLLLLWLVSGTAFGQSLGSYSSLFNWQQTPVVVKVSSNTTLSPNTVYFVDTTAPRTLTLPAPAAGLTIWIKDISGQAGTNNVTVLRHAAEQIEGVASSYTMSTNYDSIQLTSDGTNWWSI